ncbi:MAG: hypothetical protein AAFR38_02470 [Planctomycetota bacterium]
MSDVALPDRRTQFWSGVMALAVQSFVFFVFVISAAAYDDPVLYWGVGIWAVAVTLIMLPLAIVACILLLSARHPKLRLLLIGVSLFELFGAIPSVYVLKPEATP